MNKHIFPFLCCLLFWSCTKNQPQAPSSTGTATGQNLLQRLRYNYDFSDFYGAVIRVHLDTLLEGAGPLTLLVPDNTAFQNVGISADSLNRMDTAQLRILLKYHIVPGNITYEDVPQALDYVFKNLDSLPLYFSEPLPGNSQEENLSLKIVHINGVSVTQTDVLASNGVIQVLAAPLIYPSPSVKNFLVNNPQYSLFTSGLTKFGLLNQLDSVGPWEVLAPSNSCFQNWGIDQDSINRMDTLTYYKYLFGAYIMPHTLFFESDINDGPSELTGNAGNAWYVTPQYVLNFYFGYLSVYPLNYQEQVNAGGYPYPWGDYSVNISDPDHLALNGIVEGINGLLVYPDSALVKP